MKNLLFLFISLYSINLMSQISGEVTYMEKTKQDVYSQLSSMVSEEAAKKLLSSVLNVNKDLTFDKEQSIYKKSNKKLDESKSDAIQTIKISKESIYYVNRENKEIVEQKMLGKKKYLMQEDLPQYEWVIENEYKDILGRKCQKASMKNNEEVTAWFSKDIPTNAGPHKYWGLPGLILEVEDEKKITTCVSITIKNELSKIEKPMEGKLVSREEYKKLSMEEAKKQAMFFGSDSENVIRIKN